MKVRFCRESPFYTRIHALVFIGEYPSPHHTNPMYEGEWADPSMKQKRVIKKLLEEKFSSFEEVPYVDRYGRFIFDLNDEADAAAFTLWSNVDIEI
jgi:hypothetical protein